MAFFQSVYQKLLYWARHKHAVYYLAGISFIESSFFPIPPDLMLIPMVMSEPQKAWRYAFITMVASVLGGIFGYVIGFYCFEWVGMPLIHFYGLEHGYDLVVQWFRNYGVAAVIIAGFTPIPYKLFTLSAGVSQMPLIPFILASMVGRSLRFYLVATLIYKFGKKIEPLVLKYIDRLSWAFLFLLGIGFVVYKFI